MNDKGEYVVSSGESNNGVVGKTDIKAKVFSKNTLTIDMFGNSYYHSYPYKMVTHARVFSLSPINHMNLNERIGLYILASLSYFKHLFSYNNMCSWEKIRNLYIELPVDRINNINFSYIEERTRELEEERTRELEAYLKEAGFENCTLTEEENLALSSIDKIEMHKVNMGDYFKFYKGKRLTKANMISGDINFIGATAVNNGITCKIANSSHIHPSNTITVTYNGSVGEAFYQTERFWASDDVNVLYYKDTLNENLALYFLAPIRRQGKGYAYSFKWTKEKMEKDSIWVPCKMVRGKAVLDTNFMETYINAIKKQCIAALKKEFSIEHRAYEKVVSANDTTIQHKPYKLYIDTDVPWVAEKEDNNEK